MRDRDGMGKTIGVLLEHGAAVNATDKFGDTPLHQAYLKRRDEKIISLLLSHGADVLLTNNAGESVMSMACDTGFVTMLDGMLEHKRPETWSYK